MNGTPGQCPRIGTNAACDARCGPQYGVGAPCRIPPAPFSYREPVDMVCDVCGAKHCHGHPQESGVGR